TWLRRTPATADVATARAQSKAAAFRLPRPSLHLRQSKCPSRGRREKASYARRLAAVPPCIPRRSPADSRTKDSRELTPKRVAYPGSRIRSFPAADPSPRAAMEFRYTESRPLSERTNLPEA